MKTILYKLEELGNGLHVFKEFEANLQPSDVALLKPVTKEFFYTTQTSKFVKIKNNFYSQLFKNMGFEDSDKIISVVYENKRALHNYLVKKSPELLLTVLKYIESGDVFDNEDEYISELVKKSIIQSGLTKSLRNINEIEKILIPPFIDIDFLVDEDFPFQISNIFRKKTNSMRNNVFKIRQIGKKINDDYNGENNGYSNTTLGEDKILTRNIAGVFAVGKIDFKNKNFKFTSLMRSKENNVNYLVYNGYQLYFDNHFPDENYNSVILFNYNPVLYAFFEAKYIILPEKDNDEFNEISWPETGKMIFPWHIPINRSKNIITIKSNFLPESAGSNFYIPGKKLREIPISIKEPILMATAKIR